jgi:protein ImuB
MFACMHAPNLPDSHSALLHNCAYGFSPRVEETDVQTAVLDIAGLERLFGPPERMAAAMRRRAAELGLRVNVAVASNPDAAVHAARGFAGITLIPPGEEGRVLGPLPISLLGGPPELEETLALWGIRSFRDLAALPEAGLSERLGAEGVRLQKLARGAGDRPLVPRIPATGFEASLELEHPVAQLEPLRFLLARLLNEILAKLQSGGLAADELRLRLKLQDQSEHARALRLPFPMLHNKTFLKLLELDLESHPPRAPVTAITLGAAAAVPRLVQYSLFLPPAPEAEKLELTLGRIRKLVGEENVGSPELLDTHRPGAFRMKPFGDAAVLRPWTGANAHPHLALRVFRPPRRAEVEAPSGQPSRIAARGVGGSVIAAAGPWRTSGQWWTPASWSRDEWDVALSNGALYRIYLDRQSGYWFVEGSYD